MALGELEKSETAKLCAASAEVPLDVLHRGNAQEMVPKVGLEPTQYRYRRILNPLRLPIPPLWQVSGAHCNEKMQPCKEIFKFQLKVSVFQAENGCRTRF